MAFPTPNTSASPAQYLTTEPPTAPPHHRSRKTKSTRVTTKMSTRTQPTKVRFLPAAEHPSWESVMIPGARVLKDIRMTTKPLQSLLLPQGIYSVFNDYGVQELVKSILLGLNTAFTKKNNKGVDEMWVIVTAIGLWFNEGNIMP